MILSDKWFASLGGISPFYMIHQLVISVANYVITKMNIDNSWYCTFFILLIFTVILSFVVFYYIEKPLSEWLKIKCTDEKNGI